MKVKPLAYCILAATSAYSTPGFTAEDDSLDTVVVSASRIKESIASIPYTAQIIDSKEIQKQAQPGQNLGQVLGSIVPGLGPGDDSATGFYQSIRGRKVLILIDGVAQRSGRNVSRQMKTISPENIERVEVISGATAVYGAGATGGVINIITKRGIDQDTQFNTKLGMTMNMENTDSEGFTYFGSQSVSGFSDSFDYLLNANYETRGNFYDSNGDQIATDPNQVSRDNSDTLDVLANLGWQISDEQSLRASLSFFEEEQDTEYAADFGEPDPVLGLPQGILGRGGDYTPTPKEGLNLDDQPLTNRIGITLDFNDQDFLGHTLLTQLSYRENEYYFYPYPSSPLFVGVDWAGVAGSGATTPETILLAIQANATGASGTLLQSKVNTNVTDFKIALDKEFDLDGSKLNLTYGFDYIHDVSSQTSIEYSYTDWVQSGQIEYASTGSEYDAGPESTTDTYAMFLQGKWNIGKHWTVRGGVRYEHSEVEVSDTISGIDIANAEYYQAEAMDPAVGLIAGALGMTPEQFLSTAINGIAGAAGYSEYMMYSDTAYLREGGTESYSEPLFNAGAVYAINDQQEVFGNYSEGFTVPDMTRLLRSVTVFTDGGNQGPILEGTNVEAVKTHSFDLGWRGRFNNITAQTSAFYNNSDKNIEFDREIGVVTIRDVEEEFWGVEAILDARFDSGFNTGLTYARTYGETEDDNGDTYALGADRVTPEKITAYLGYGWNNKADARLQVTHLSDYKTGHQESPENIQDQVVPFEGYRTFDLITNFYTSVGDFSASIRNLANTEYYSVYNQVRGYPSGGASAYLPAQGRTFSLSYSLDY